MMPFMDPFSPESGQMPPSSDPHPPSQPKHEQSSRRASFAPPPTYSPYAQQPTATTLAPPPPPQAYNAQTSARLPVNSGESSGPRWRDPDPIPAPPAKYALPSISEALRRIEEQPPASRPDMISAAPTPPQLPPQSPHVEGSGVYHDAELLRGVSQPQYAPHIAPVLNSARPMDNSARRSMTPVSYLLEARRMSSAERAYYPPHSLPSTTPQPLTARPAEEWRSTYAAAGPEAQPPSHYHNQPAYSQPLTARRDSTMLPPPPPPPTTKIAYAPHIAPQRHELPPAPSSNTWTPSRDDALAQPAARPIYGESVKRHLNGFDFEQAVNNIAESSHTLNEFGEYYRARAHHMQQTGPLPDSTPQLQHIDDMMRHGSRIQESLNRLRDVVVTQQAELVEFSREQALKHLPDDDMAGQDDSKGGAGFSGFSATDAKKRRGRAAPPGKCHSCNRVDTPEWRRGPDGARTLCNACGLHYAKLTRKAVSNGPKPTAPGPSALMPKDD